MFYKKLVKHFSEQQLVFFLSALTITKITISEITLVDKIKIG